MADYIAVKLLNLRSELGWFKGIYDRRQLPGEPGPGPGLKGNQKGITISADHLRAMYPMTVARQAAYDAEKGLQKAARAAADAHEEAARLVGSITVHATIVGPGAHPGPDSPPDIDAPERVIALQDKNWRLNGKFIEDPPGEPTRFESTLDEGDLAILGFTGIEEPTAVTVILLDADNPHD